MRLRIKGNKRQTEGQQKIHPTGSRNKKFVVRVYSIDRHIQPTTSVGFCYLVCCRLSAVSVLLSFVDHAPLRPAGEDSRTYIGTAYSGTAESTFNFPFDPHRSECFDFDEYFGDVSSVSEVDVSPVVRVDCPANDEGEMLQEVLIESGKTLTIKSTRGFARY